MKENTPTFVADADLAAALQQYGHPHRCSGDETLFFQGQKPEALYLLKEGQVTLTAQAAGRERVFARENQRDSIFGLPGVISNTPYSLTARAVAGSQFQIIPPEAFQAMLRANPEMNFHALRILASEVQAARRILHDVEDEKLLKKKSAPKNKRGSTSGNSDRIGS